MNHVGLVVCIVFGHRPEHYSVDEGAMTTEFTECSRCCCRKNLSGTGWLYE